MAIQGIGSFVKAFEETKSDGYVPTESWLQKQQQQKKEKKEANERRLQQAIAECKYNLMITQLCSAS